MKRGRVGFLKPSDEDDNVSGYQEDRPDLDTNSQTSFVYNPYQVKYMVNARLVNSLFPPPESGYRQAESQASHSGLQRQSSLPAGESSGDVTGGKG